MTYKISTKDRNKLMLLPLIAIAAGIFFWCFIPNSEAPVFVFLVSGFFTACAVWALWYESNQPPTIKVGLDLHGVISAHPKFFSELSKSLVKSGAEVHIITGSHSVEILDEIKKYNITYTHLFSIADYHRSIGTPMWYDANRTPWIDKKLWEMTKAEYCQREGIDFHLDDSDIYGEHFTTPYAKIAIKGYQRRIRHK